jgi:hypothetical protein
MNTYTTRTLTDAERTIAREHAEATRAMSSGKLTADEYRAGNADRRARIGDNDVWNIVKGAALSMAFDGKA